MNKEEFVSELGKIGINCSSSELLLLDKYYNLLIEWNSKINLTAITLEEDVYLKHFYDSLTMVKVIDLNNVESLCDIGTGAGFPGIVLKIFFPHLKLTLVDALNKRINFLSIVVNELSLDNVTLVHARAEEYALKVREEFDVVTARAVASLPMLLEYSIPLVKVSKNFIAYKGVEDISLISSVLDILNIKIFCIEEFDLPVDGGRRNLICFEKKEVTSSKYPRRFSEIKKKPL